MIKLLKSILYNKYQSYKFRKIISRYDKNLKLSSIKNNNETMYLNQNGYLILNNYIENIDNYEIKTSNWNQHGKSVKKISNVLITKKSIIHKILIDKKINDIVKGYLGVDAVLDYAEKDGNTLVVVTADHETGGLALRPASYQDADGISHNDYDAVEGSFNTGGHTAALIPVFAYGPGASEFQGFYENTEIFNKFLKLLK